LGDFANFRGLRFDTFSKELKRVALTRTVADCVFVRPFHRETMDVIASQYVNWC
jgi:hypothetical protein